MNEGEHIFTALHHAKSLPHLANGPYIVPDSYFEKLDVIILQKIYSISATGGEEDEILPVLSSISKRPPYTVPAGYFSQGPEVYGILRQISKKPVQAISEGYFKSVAEQTRNKILPKRSRQFRIIGLNTKRWAIAATVTGLVAIVSIWLLLNKKAENPEGYGAVLLPQHIKSVSTEQLRTFLNSFDSTLLYNDPVQSGRVLNNEFDFNQLFYSLTDKELKIFLEETGDDTEDYL